MKWTSQFDLGHGLANHHRKGRVFLAGDAAHIHSPVGGQGLNTGVQDAHNLLWKLAMVDRLDSPEAAEKLLDSYEAERRETARSMVTGVARVTAALTTRRSLARRVIGPLARVRRPAWMHTLWPADTTNDRLLNGLISVTSLCVKLVVSQFMISRRQ